MSEEVKLPQIISSESDDRISEILSSVIVPVAQSQCRICNWYKDKIELYAWLCNKTMEGISYGIIRSALADYLKEKYPSIKSPSKKSIWNHFEKHLQAKESTALIAARNQYTIEGDLPLISDKVLKKLGEGNFDEYNELCALYVKFREVHDKIYTTNSALLVNNQNGVAVWSQSRIQSYNSMINTQKSILAEISKMRQGNKMLSVATKFIIETYVSSIINKLSEEFRSLVTVMKRQQVDDDIISAFEDMIGVRLASILVNEAEGAMNVTKKEFKLPN